MNSRELGDYIYDQFNANKTFVDEETRGIRSVQSITENITEIMTNETTYETTSATYETTSDLIEDVTETAVTFASNLSTTLASSVANNVSIAIETLAEELSTLYDSYNSTATNVVTEIVKAVNATTIANLPTTKSTLPADVKHSQGMIGVWLFCACLLVSVVLLIARFSINRCSQNRSSRSLQEEETTASQIMAKYRARYPCIEEEDEGEVQTSQVNERATSGAIRKPEPLISTELKLKKKNDYAPLEFSWDFDEEAIDEVVEENTPLKEIGTQTNNSATAENMETALTMEEINILKEECKNFKYMDD